MSVEPEVDCVFCEELRRGKAIDELEHTAVLEDLFPVTKGHVLVIPRRHVSDLFSLSDQEVKDIWRLLNSVRRTQSRADPSIEGYNLGVNNGSVAGQTVPHVHVHLIPRRAGDTPDPRGGVRGVIPGQMDYLSR
jgi:diadenosine tetraphosphate (Ap4A) HIT family hydrolase